MEEERQALTLDCGNHWPGWPVNQKIHWPPKKPTGPPKTCNDPNVFSAGIYDFTREVAHFCTLGLYITKNKYELTLPSEFCRFPVKIMAAYEALKKKQYIYNKLWWPDSLKKACGPAERLGNWYLHLQAVSEKATIIGRFLCQVCQNLLKCHA